jgi:hypothetical protein
MPGLVPIESTVLNAGKSYSSKTTPRPLSSWTSAATSVVQNRTLGVVSLVRVAAPIDEERGAVSAFEHEVVLDRFWRELEPELLLVELLARNEVGRAEDRRDPVTCHHGAHLPVSTALMCARLVDFTPSSVQVPRR